MSLPAAGSAGMWTSTADAPFNWPAAFDKASAPAMYTPFSSTGTTTADPAVAEGDGDATGAWLGTGSGVGVAVGPVEGCGLSVGVTGLISPVVNDQMSDSVLPPYSSSAVAYHS
ncbi:hypothetical protein D3C81_1424470 [compost metagenome]